MKKQTLIIIFGAAVLTFFALGTLTAEEAVVVPVDGSTPQTGQTEDKKLEPKASFNPDPDWSSAKADVPAEITVAQGDTLWDLCEKHLGNPWFWQKVWKLNPEIADPHWIYPGAVVKMRPTEGEDAKKLLNVGGKANLEGIGDNKEDGGKGGEEEGDIKIVEEEKIEEEVGTVYELGTSKKQLYADLRKKQKQLTSVRREGFVSASEIKSSGKVVGSPFEKTLFTQHDIVYLKFGENAPKIGDVFQIYRIDGEVEHPVTGDFVGNKIQILGKVKVEAVNEKDCKGRIINAYAEIERGDLLRPWSNPYRSVIKTANKKDLNGYIIDRLGHDEYMFDWTIVYLDKGVNDGVEEGNHMQVVRDLDSFKFSVVALEGDEKFPPVTIAELIVLSTGSATSTAIVIKSAVEIEIGDKFVMKKE
jgi:hypothetical protein